jgi:hypothetical protein
MRVAGQPHAPAALPMGETRYPLHRRLGRPQDRSGRVRKNSPTPGFDPRTVQPVASPFTNLYIYIYKVSDNQFENPQTQEVSTPLYVMT